MADPSAKDVADRVRAELERARKALALAIDANLRAAPDEGGTPIDTGHARRNWVPSALEPFAGEAVSEAQHEAGVTAVLSAKLGADLFVSNNVPYIEHLNLGSSKQAPAGFVEAAVDRAVATVQSQYDSLQLDVTTTGAGTFGDTAGGAAAGNLAAAFEPGGSGSEGDA